jgi:hypothetical protein
MIVWEKIKQFVRGRYGNDELNRVLSFSALGLCVISMAVRFPWLNTLALALLAISLYRSLSRNTHKRTQEAEIYFGCRIKVTSFFSWQIEKWKGRKTYRFFSCPICRKHLRVPKGVGQVSIKCPRCGKKFLQRG